MNPFKQGWEDQEFGHPFHSNYWTHPAFHIGSDLRYRMRQHLKRLGWKLGWLARWVVKGDSDETA